MAENVLMRDCPDKVRRADISNRYKGVAPVTKTSAYTMTADDSGKLFNHTGAAGSVTLTFPSSLPIGWWCEVLHDENQSLVLAASGTGCKLNGFDNYTSDNTQDPTAFARVTKVGSLAFSVERPFGTWTGA